MERGRGQRHRRRNGRGPRGQPPSTEVANRQSGGSRSRGGWQGVRRGSSHSQHRF